MQVHTFSYEGKDVDVSRTAGRWTVTSEGKGAERRQLDVALEEVLGPPRAFGRSSDAFTRLAVDILDYEEKNK